jgi:addiction module HigA family antidote
MGLKQHNPLHPGEFIKRVYLDSLVIGLNELAEKLEVGTDIFSCLIKGKTDVSPEMALKLSNALGRSTQSWLSMQNNYNIWKENHNQEGQGVYKSPGLVRPRRKKH